MEISRHAELEAFVTADGSIIREWAGPGRGADARHQSLAEATLPPGGATIAHYHPRAEELYLFTAGRGRMRLGDEERDVLPGDCVSIPPGAIHKLWNTGDADLVLVCACSPPYSHEDTVLVEDATSS